MCVIKHRYELNIKFLWTADEAGLMSTGHVYSTRKVVGEAVEVGVKLCERCRTVRGSHLDQWGDFDRTGEKGKPTDRGS